jgi:DNA helicase-4
VNDIKFIYQSKLLQSFYNLNETELKNEILSGLNITINKIGTKRLFDGKIYHSNGDYRIAKSLRENHIDFIYNMKYPYQNKTNYRCDFFLPNYEIYIEYFGLLKNNFNENTKIIYDYKEKMDLKILFCQENGLNLIYDINLNKLLTKINNKINEKQSI